MMTRSVTSSLARALFAIALLSVFSTGLAMLTLSASLRDAEAVNIAGSLRMQSYRLAWDATTNSPDLAKNIQLYHQSLDAPALRALDRRYVPTSVRERYHALLHAWQKLRPDLEAGKTLDYRQNVSHYVAQIDRFVLALQHWAELKMLLVAGTSVLGFIAIAALVVWTLRRVRRQVVLPLNKLVMASHEIEQANFHPGPLDTGLENELGVLARAFTHMSSELEKHYHHLEEAVKEKTQDLRQANRRLALLYRCSEMLSSHMNSAQAYPQVLERMLQHEALCAISLTAPPQWEVTVGQPDEKLAWQRLQLDPSVGAQAGELRWQALRSEPQLMQGFATLLARSLQLERAQHKVQHLLLMEERATIARELHDSLAQSLAYLRIQLARLKRVVDENAAPARAIVTEIDQALSEANRQLRELLTTFRLSIEPADLPTALEQVIAPLRQQTSATILLEGQLTGQHLEAQKQVHVLQIVREALLNAIRHASATQIAVRCSLNEQGENRIEICDNGKGLADPESPPGHYGLSIMQERASSLNGNLTVSQIETGGTRVSLIFSDH
ncbi:nitrate/nitrite two-component system sensor histidine kinase NarQ [Erwinia sp. P6884]|uniref:nitrate/nitrite two-component system sensor histidine kinase NarQ n=1 Tax=Erwinia sp. P6884 TaxID=3141450 RepID=UPI00319CAD64